MTPEPAKSKPAAKLSPNELAIMTVLWDRKQATGRDVLDHLGQPMAQTTLLTYLSRLEAKGYVKRFLIQREPGAGGAADSERYAGRYGYKPAVRRLSVATRLLDQAMRHFDNRLSTLVSHFAKTRKISDEERRRLRAVLDRLDSPPAPPPPAEV